MMGTEFHFRGKIPVAILGATGCVGQKLIQLLIAHPWFEITTLCASERSAGKLYGEVVNWLMPVPLPHEISRMTVQRCQPSPEVTLVFSGLDSSIAGEIETVFATAGKVVVSNSSSHRMDPDVPLLIAEVNPDQLQLVKSQRFEKGMIVTNPNCSVIGFAIALKPLMDQFGLESAHVTTMQAVSGAGFPGIASLDIIDNLIPYIRGEEEKVETEPLKIFGTLEGSRLLPSKMKISAQCNRIAVTDGHSASVAVKLKRTAEPDEIIKAWRTFQAEPQKLGLPMAPFHPIHYFEQEHYPQPKLHRELDKGMALSIGRLRRCPVMDFKFSILSHNTIRGAAGAAILNAELMVKKGLIYW